jgi:hypothetical protein
MSVLAFSDANRLQLFGPRYLGKFPITDPANLLILTQSTLLRLRPSRSFQPRRHRADTCASVDCPASESASLTPSAGLAQMAARPSALFRLRPMTDLPAFRPLHSLPHSASLHRQDALARSDGRKLARQSGTVRALPKTPRAARLRPATAAPLWARCSACRPGQDPRNSRETGQLCVAALANRPDSLMVAIRKDV